MARRVKFMPYPQFDRRQLEIKPLSERVHDMTLDHLLKLDDPIPPVDDPALPRIAERIVHARQAGRPVILAHGRARYQARPVAPGDRFDGARFAHTHCHEWLGSDS